MYSYTVQTLFSSKYIVWTIMSVTLKECILLSVFFIHKKVFIINIIYKLSKMTSALASGIVAAMQDAIVNYYIKNL